MDQEFRLGSVVILSVITLKENFIDSQIDLTDDQNSDQNEDSNEQESLEEEEPIVNDISQEMTNLTTDPLEPILHKSPSSIVVQQ